MDRTWILHGHLCSPSYVYGIQGFMEFVRTKEGPNQDMYCPCQTCMNGVKVSQRTLGDHLYIYGMGRTYTRWIYHGEPYDDPIVGEADLYHLDQLGQAGLDDHLGLVGEIDLDHIGHVGEDAIDHLDQAGEAVVDHLELAGGADLALMMDEGAEHKKAALNEIGCSYGTCAMPDEKKHMAEEVSAGITDARGDGIDAKPFIDDPATPEMHRIEEDSQFAVNHEEDSEFAENHDEYCQIGTPEIIPPHVLPAEDSKANGDCSDDEPFYDSA